MCTVVILSIHSHTVPPKAMCNNSKSGGVKNHNKRMVLGGSTYHRYSGRCAYLLQTIKNGDGGLVCVYMCVWRGGGGVLQVGGQSVPVVPLSPSGIDMIHSTTGGPSAD